MKLLLTKVSKFDTTPLRASFFSTRSVTQVTFFIRYTNFDTHLTLYKRPAKKISQHMPHTWTPISNFDLNNNTA